MTTTAPGETEPTPSAGEKMAIPPIELEVTHLDGSKETVKVRQLRLSEIRKCALLVAWGNEAEAIELSCDKPEGWADTLTCESATAVADKGQEINLRLLEWWSEHQRKWREVLTDAAKPNE